MCHRRSIALTYIDCSEITLKNMGTIVTNSHLKSGSHRLVFSAPSQLCTNLCILSREGISEVRLINNDVRLVGKCIVGDDSFPSLRTRDYADTSMENIPNNTGLQRSLQTEMEHPSQETSNAQILKYAGYGILVLWKYLLDYVEWSIRNDGVVA